MTEEDLHSHWGQHKFTLDTAVWRIQRRRAETKKHLPADVLLSWVWIEVVRFVTALRTSATSVLNPETSALRLLDSSSCMAITFWLLALSSRKNCLVLESSATKSHLCTWTFVQVNVATMWWHCCRRPFRCLHGPYNFISTFDKWVLYLNKWAHNKESMRTTLITDVWRNLYRKAGTWTHLPVEVLLSWMWMTVVRFVTALLTFETLILNSETSPLSFLFSSSSPAVTLRLVANSSWNICWVLDSSAGRKHISI